MLKPQIALRNHTIMETKKVGSIIKKRSIEFSNVYSIRKKHNLEAYICQKLSHVCF